MNRLSKVLLILIIGSSILTCSGKMDPRYLSPGYPVVTSINPNTGIVSGGQLVTITGYNFRTNLDTVALGGSKCTVQTITPTQITCITTKHTSNAVDVTVTASDTLEVGNLSKAYGYKAYLYATGSAPSAVYSFGIDPFTGVLTATTTPSIGYGGTGYGINVHPSNTFLYVGDAAGAAGGNTLTGFLINQATGNLTLIGVTGAPTSPQNPDAFAFTSDGNYMFVGSAVGGAVATVTSYIVDQVTGALTPNGATVPAPACKFGGQIVVDSANANLYMSCNSAGSGDANAGLAAYSITPGTGQLVFTSFVHGGSGDAISMDLTGTYIYAGTTGPAGVAGACGAGAPFDTSAGVSVYLANGGNPVYVESCNHGDAGGAGVPRGSGSSVEQNNHWLVTSSRVTGKIEIWDISGGLPIYQASYAASAGTNDARFDKTGRFMYDSSNGSVDFYNIDLNTGIPTNGVPFVNTSNGSPGVSDVTY